MLSTIDLVVAALSTGHKIGLATVGGAFILFALVSSFLLPLRNPNFPGRAVGWYVTLTVLFFVAMVSAVLVFGREKKEAATEKPPGQTTTAPGQTTSSGSGVQGNPEAGKGVFASAGCASCHTLKAAAAKGTVGPNLDQLKPPYTRIITQVENGGGPMPAFKSRLSDAQIHDVAAFVFTSTHR